MSYQYPYYKRKIANVRKKKGWGVGGGGGLKVPKNV